MDDDDDFMFDDDGDVDFEFEDDDGDEPDADLENQYYNAKATKEEDPQGAVEEFKALVQSEGQLGEWGFKALKQIIKTCVKLGHLKEALKHYEELLKYIESAVTKNYSEKSINNLLDYVSSSPDIAFLERFYQLTLSALEFAKNERLWMKTNLKQAKLLLDRKQFANLSKILRKLKAICAPPEGSADMMVSDDHQRKGTHLLEVYALEIQMYTETKDTKKLKELYQKTLRVKSAIPHPKIMGVIRECGGKMHMANRDWAEAQTEFFESFKNYDEAGAPERIRVLKYLVLSNMLMASPINPFDSQETKPYQKDQQIVPMTNLVNMYHARNVREFERILRENREDVMEDAFMKEYIDDVLKSIRSQVLIGLIKPYTRISLDFIAKKLNISMEEVEDLLVGLILDNKIHGAIDEMNHVIEMEELRSSESRYKAMDKWATNLGQLFQAIVAKVS